MLFSGGFTFSNFLTDVFSIFIFVLWFWLLITVFSDLFRRHDISGWAKVIWVIALIIFPYLGIFKSAVLCVLLHPVGFICHLGPMERQLLDGAVGLTNFRGSAN